VEPYSKFLWGAADFNIRLRAIFYGEGLTLLNADIIDLAWLKLKVRGTLNAASIVAYLKLPMQQDIICRCRCTCSLLLLTLHGVGKVWNKWEFYLLFILYALYVHPDTLRIFSATLPCLCGSCSKYWDRQ
jgi:hypothetical protein